METPTSANKKSKTKVYDPSLRVRDVVYWKDFKYLNHQVKKRPREPNSFSLRRFISLWFEELVNGVRQMFYEGSLHGCKYIFEPSFSRKEKAVWIIIVGTSVTICFLNIIQLFMQWTSSPYVNVMDSLQTPIWAVPFPSVVLCPHLHVKLSYRNMSKLDHLDTFFASLVCPKMARNQISTKQRLTLAENEKLHNFLIEASPKCSEIIRGCFWRAVNDQKWLTKECCDHLFKPVFTNYGRCYAFNRLPLNGMSNSTTKWQQKYDQSVSSRSLLWNLDEGYPRVFPPKAELRPFRSMASGEMNGLVVELYFNVSDHQYDCDDNSLGFNLLIQSPTNHLYTSTVLRLPLARMTTIEVSPTTYKTDKELKSLRPGRRQCFFQSERNLDYYSVYTDSNCKHNLLITESKKLCGCVLFNWPRKSVTEPICSTEKDFQCLFNVSTKVEEQLIAAYFEDSSDQHSSSDTPTSCYLPCNDILYTNQVFYSDLKMQSNPFVPNEKISLEGETTRFNVHFYDDMFIGLHRHTQYDEYYFAGAIGGLLSLFLGFSIISVAELIYFVIMRPFHIAVCDLFCNEPGF